MNTITFRQATKDDAMALAELINFAGEGMPYYLWEGMAEDATIPDGYASATLELHTGAIHFLQGGAGDTVVLLHHSTGSPGWIPLCAELARDFQVFVPDMTLIRRLTRIGWPGGVDVLTVLFCHLVYVAVININTAVGKTVLDMISLQ